MVFVSVFLRDVGCSFLCFWQLVGLLALLPRKPSCCWPSFRCSPHWTGFWARSGPMNDPGPGGARPLWVRRPSGPLQPGPTPSGLRLEGGRCCLGSRVPGVHGCRPWLSQPRPLSLRGKGACSIESHPSVHHLEFAGAVETLVPTAGTPMLAYEEEGPHVEMEAGKSWDLSPGPAPSHVERPEHSAWKGSGAPWPQQPSTVGPTFASPSLSLLQVLSRWHTFQSDKHDASCS